MRSGSAVVAVLATGLGCAAPTMYRWGDYNDALYHHYKNPNDRDEFVAKLREVIEAAEKAGSIVPPGCYAEYGWALLEAGHDEEAVGYFEKEGKQWPDSRPLMEKLIRNVVRARQDPPSAMPASAVEEEKR
jgi:hypothetical protein